MTFRPIQGNWMCNYTSIEALLMQQLLSQLNDKSSLPYYAVACRLDLATKM